MTTITVKEMAVLLQLAVGFLDECGMKPWDAEEQAGVPRWVVDDAIAATERLISEAESSDVRGAQALFTSDYWEKAVESLTAITNQGVVVDQTNHISM